MFSGPDLAVILAVILIIFGPGKLPEIGSSIGKAIKGFKKATEEETPPLDGIEQPEHKPDTVNPPKNPGDPKE